MLHVFYYSNLICAEYNYVRLVETEKLQFIIYLLVYVLV